MHKGRAVLIIYDCNQKTDAYAGVVLRNVVAKTRGLEEALYINAHPLTVMSLRSDN